jgi:hypothetical protein
MVADRKKIVHTLAVGRRIKMKLDIDTKEWSADEVSQGYQLFYKGFWVKKEGKEEKEEEKEEEK